MTTLSKETIASFFTEQSVAAMKLRKARKEGKGMDELKAQIEAAQTQFHQAQDFQHFLAVTPRKKLYHAVRIGCMMTGVGVV